MEKNTIVTNNGVATSVAVIEDAKYELLRTPEGRIPQMKITLLDGEGNTIRIGYLTPFRKYRFQVSGNAEGSGDFGSSFVMDLPEIITKSAKPYVASDMLEMMAQLAISNFVKITLNQGREKICAKCIDFYTNANDNTFGKFIEESMKWILGDDLNKHGIECNHIWDEAYVAYCDE